MTLVQGAPRRSGNMLSQKVVYPNACIVAHAVEVLRNAAVLEVGHRTLLIGVQQILRIF